MYSHPMTAKQLRVVQEELGYKVHGPIAKTLACGDIGERLCIVPNIIGAHGVSSGRGWSDV